eukprot:748628-Hanusia_phi.AAC.1
MAEDKNVANQALAKCDRSKVNDPKFPTTGWRRQDLCTAEDEDHGSHFVCVDMPSDFWVKTGQACLPERLHRHKTLQRTGRSLGHGASVCGEDAPEFLLHSPPQCPPPPPPPPPLPVLIAQCRAYASYLNQENSFQQNLICDATNQWVLHKYDKTVPSQCRAL